APLSAAPFRLPRGRADRLGSGGDIRNHGAAALPRHHGAGAGNDLRLWLPVACDSRGGRLAPAMDLGEAGPSAAADRVSFWAGGVAPCVCRGPHSAFGSLLPDGQRAADL